MEAVKEKASNLVSSVTGNDPQTGAGEFGKPGNFGDAQTQKGTVVGIEHDMKNKPHPVKQEADGGFETYKAAGKLIGKKAIVTGGDSGIGRAVTIMYAMEGAQVAIIYLPEEEVDAQKTVKLCLQYGGQPPLTYAQDIRDEAGVNTTIAAIVQKFGGTLDILVNNASVMYSTPTIDEISFEQFDRTIKTNIYGTFFVTKAAIKSIPKGGSIIVTVSQVAYAGSPSLIDYSMTKGAGVGLVRSLSQNLLEKGIRVNGVAPGPVWTPLQESAMDQKTLDQWQQSPAPIGRIGQPSEIGPAYVFLASADGSFFTGQVLHANGGTVING